MSTTGQDALALDRLIAAEQALQYTFTNKDLLSRSLTHASSADHRLQSNERLEFLGDAVLGLVVCFELYQRFRDWPEGELTKIKSAVVSRRTCAGIADDIGICEHMVLGKGIGSPRTLPVSLRSAVIEAIIGAIYEDGGLEPARDFIMRHLKVHIDRAAVPEDQVNHKSHLQQFAQRTLSATPYYEALDEQGPDHSKCFEVCVVLDGKRYPSAWGPSKKEAEQAAAQKALEAMRDTYKDNGHA